MTSESFEHTIPSTLSAAHPVGQIIAEKYEIQLLVGTGGMGAVYKVRQIFLDEHFALKLLALTSIVDGVQLRRFQQEAKAARSLNHPNLVRVHDFGVLDNGQPYLVMDYIEGETLTEFLKENGSLTVESATLLCKQLCSGLAHAHEIGIVHRDIKPSNVIIVRGKTFGTEGSIKIVDFGIAKMMIDDETPQQLTRTGEIFGSPFYMSPEQCIGNRVDERADIYSLGCVLFESLTGTPPFVGSNSLRTMMLHETAPIPTLKEASLSREFPEEIETAIGRMLAKTPNQRYPTVLAVADEWDTACKSTALARIKTDNKDNKDKKYNKSKIVVIAVSTLVLCVLSFCFIAYKTTPPKPPEKPKDRTLADQEILHALADGVHVTDSAVMPKSNWDGRPIKSTIIRKGSTEVREFVFPSAPIGVVTTHLQKSTRNWQQLIVQASGTRDFPLNEPLTFLIDFEQFPGGFPDDYKYIASDEFFGLHLKGSGLNALFESTAPKNQRKFMLDVLKVASHWKNLQAVFLEQVPLDDELMNELDRLPCLENLLIERPYEGFAATRNHDFFQALRRVWLTATVLEPFTDKMRASSRLDRLVVANCAISTKALDNLRDCSALRELHLLQPNLNKHLMEHLAALDQLQILNLSQSDLSVSDVRLLLNQMKLKRLVVSAAVFAKTQAAKLLDSRIIRSQ
jgi:serine/threonine protein kinase